MEPVGSGRASISVMECGVEVVDSQSALAAPHPAHPPPMMTYFFCGVGSLEALVSSDVVDWRDDDDWNRLVVSDMG